MSSQQIDPRWGSYRSLCELLEARAREQRDATGFTFLLDGTVEGERATLTFGELRDRALSVATQLVAEGARGERVLLLFAPGMDFVVAFFACLYAGAVAVPAYPPGSRRKLPRLAAMVADARPQAVLTSAALLDKLHALTGRLPQLAGVRWLAVPESASCAPLPAGAEALASDGEIGLETLAFLQYTSGSTATPKGVMVTHGNLLHNEEMIRRAFQLEPSSCVMGWLPLYHDMGLIGNLLQPLYLGATAVLMSPIAFLQAPRRWLEAIDHFRATTSGGPNFAYELCVDRIAPGERHGLDLSSWSLAFNGAEPVRASTLQRFAEAFAPSGFRAQTFYPCYGLAEATLLVTGGDAGRLPAVRWLDEERLAAGAAVAAGGEGKARMVVSCGRPWSGQRVVVVDPESGRPLPDGAVGEIWVSGPSVAGGYWHRDEESRATFGARLATPAAVDNGEADRRFLRTGDLGFESDGELFVTGRVKDLIIVRGRNLYPQDLELSAERAHPALRAGCGAAFASEPSTELSPESSPGRTGGEGVVLVQEIDRRRESEAAEAALEIRTAVASEHDVQPERVVVVRAGEVPKTSSGKVQRARCRRLLAAGELTILATDDRADGGPSGQEAAAEGPGAVRGALGWEGGRAALAALPPSQRRAAVEALLAEELAAAARVGRRALVAEVPLTALGLDSLAAVELQHAVRERLGARVSVAELLDGATLVTLADEVSAQLDAEHTPSALDGPAAVGPAEGDHPVSPGQRALWLLTRLAPDNPAYNLVAAVRIAGGADAEASRTAVGPPAVDQPSLDPAALQRACHRLAERHPVLRAGFPVARQGERAGEPWMRVAAESEILVETLAPPLEPEGALRLAADFAYAPFDIEHGPLLRLGMQPLLSGEVRLVLAVHHLACDFWSLALMFRDLGRLYAQECSARESAARGQPRSLPAWPAPELRYSDWVRWQRERGAVQNDDAPPTAGTGEDPACRTLEFWRRELAEVPALDLPADRSRPPLPSYRGGRVTGLLPAPVAGRLRAVAAAAGVTPFSVLLAAFELQLERYSGQQRFAVGTPTAGRDAAGVREVVGYFVNPLPVVADLRAPVAASDGQPAALSAAAALARTAASARATLEHSRLALQELVERLGGAGRNEEPGEEPGEELAVGPSARGRDASRAPIFQVMFVYQRPHLAGAASLAAAALGASGYPLDLGGLPLVTEALPERGAPFDLMLSAGELPALAEPADGGTAAQQPGGQIGLALQYSGDLYDPASAERMMGHYRILVTALVDALSSGGELPVAALPLLSQAERGQLLESWSRPATVEVPAETLDGLVAAAAARRPEQPAVISLAGTLTYRELEGRANQLAHALRRHGVRPEERVAVMLERTPSLIVALLATLKAGGLYVPIDPAYPPERQALILADSRARVVVTQDALAEAAESALAGGGASSLPRPALLRLDGDAALLAELPQTPPAPDPLSADPRRLAYLIYTSGSTGRPKGVAIEHASAVAMISWARTRFSQAELAGVLGATSVCFDLSVFEIFLTLGSGGTLVLAKDALALAGPDAAALAALWPLTLINTVPSAIAVLVEAAAIPPTVTTVNLAGEPLKGELVRRVYASAPNVERVLNLYGPSEDTTYSTWYSSEGAAERQRLRAGGEPTIGVPIANTRGYVVDRAWRPQPAGVPGLLYLGGDGLARGYFDRPSLTAGRWLPDPFAGQVAGSAAGDRVYATGDLVRWLPDGQLEFLGRADHQVKIRGFRIELGEIEAALAAHAGVAEAVVVAREDRPGEPRLVCYWAPAESSGEAAPEGEEGSAVLRRYLGERLPEFMVPALFVQLAALPQTPNGKIDRRALPALEPAAEREGLAPRSATEEALAAIWSDVLGVPRVGVRDHFFDLGGHSLLASRVASRIEAELGVQLALPELFAAPTVESLAERVDEQLLAGADADQLEALLALLEEEPA